MFHTLLQVDVEKKGSAPESEVDIVAPKWHAFFINWNSDESVLQARRGHPNPLNHRGTKCALGFEFLLGGGCEERAWVLFIQKATEKLLDVAHTPRFWGRHPKSLLLQLPVIHYDKKLDSRVHGHRECWGRCFFRKDESLQFLSKDSRTSRTSEPQELQFLFKSFNNFKSFKDFPERKEGKEEKITVKSRKKYTRKHSFSFVLFCKQPSPWTWYFFLFSLLFLSRAHSFFTFSFFLFSFLLFFVRFLFFLLRFSFQGHR